MTGHDKVTEKKKKGAEHEKEKLHSKTKLGDNQLKAATHHNAQGGQLDDSLEQLFAQNGLGALEDGPMCVDKTAPFVSPNAIVQPKAREELACLVPEVDPQLVPMLCERPLAAPLSGALGPHGFYPKHRFLALGNPTGQPFAVTEDHVLSGGHVGPFPFWVTDNVNGTDTHATDMSYFQAFQDGDSSVTCQTIPAEPSAFEALQQACVVPTPYDPLPLEILGQTNSNSFATKGAEDIGGGLFVDNLPGWAPGTAQSDAIDFGGECRP